MGRARSGKVFNTESEWRSVLNPPRHHPSAIMWSQQRCLRKAMADGPSISRLWNGGSWAKNTDIRKSMATTRGDCVLDCNPL